MGAMGNTLTRRHGASFATLAGQEARRTQEIGKSKGLASRS